MAIADLPTLNACLNLLTMLCLIGGYGCIRLGSRNGHRNFMLAAASLSALFFLSYIVYHAQQGSVRYPHFDWTRQVYFSILIPHIILAAAVFPLIPALLWFALRKRFDKHRKIAVWVWPIWMYVSISGIIVYYMLYQLRQ